jgi:uncharacterized protein (DUF849 family)
MAGGLPQMHACVLMIARVWIGRMNHDVIITCAVTGAGDSTARSPHVPVTPAQIADACLDAARAGAAIAHIHVRDSETGKACRNLAYYDEVVERVRASDVDVVLNLTCGMGGMLCLDAQNPAVMVEGTDMATPYERMEHVDRLRPEMCTLDCGSMNFGAGLAINRTADLMIMAQHAMDWGVKPELEVFDMGQVAIALKLIARGLVPGDPLFQFCLGIDGGAPATAESMIAMRSMLPPNAHWAAFGISQHEMPMAALAVVLGGNVRVGLEDNLYLERGVLATNAQLVEKAARIVRDLGARVMTPAQTREKLKLENRYRRAA